VSATRQTTLERICVCLPDVLSAGELPTPSGSRRERKCKGASRLERRHAPDYGPPNCE
jgi:hypothetical protein